MSEGCFMFRYGFVLIWFDGAIWPEHKQRNHRTKTYIYFQLHFETVVFPFKYIMRSLVIMFWPITTSQCIHQESTQLKLTHGNIITAVFFKKPTPSSCFRFELFLNCWPHATVWVTFFCGITSTGQTCCEDYFFSAHLDMFLVFFFPWWYFSLRASKAISTSNNFFSGKYFQLSVQCKFWATKRIQKHLQQEIQYLP